MRLLLPLCLAAFAVTAFDTQAQTRRRNDVPVVVLKKRSFLDAGTQVTNGRYTNYVRNMEGSSGVYPSGSIGGRESWLVKP